MTPPIRLVYLIADATSQGLGGRGPDGRLYVYFNRRTADAALERAPAGMAVVPMCLVPCQEDADGVRFADDLSMDLIAASDPDALPEPPIALPPGTVLQ